MNVGSGAGEPAIRERKGGLGRPSCVLEPEQGQNMDDRTETIARLNDCLRQTLAGGRIVMTAGVNSRDASFLNKTLAAVRSFDAFDENNDPHQEHDFGVIEVDGDELFWKIDYFDPTLTFHAADPADAHATVRVLTIMLAEEY